MSRLRLSVLLVLLLLLVACGGDDADLTVDDADPDPGDVEGADDEPDEADDEAEPADEGPEDDDPGPQPDPARVGEPCAEREGEEMEAFLDVVAPVDGQRVLDSVELVGCANVPEGTVRYRVLSAAGDALVDDFTTAECGGPCVGEYQTVVDLAGMADDHDTVTLEVFWDSPAGDGSEEDRTEVELVFD